MAGYEELVKSSQLNFVSQNLDIVHLAFDKVLLASRPYIDTIELQPTSGETLKDKTDIPDGDIWVLSKIEHRDIEPGIFTVRFVIDGLEIFPSTTLNNLQFLLPLAKAFIARKYLETTVTNTDTITKTYRVMRIWHAYNRSAVNKFLAIIGAPIIK
jgi:hypothetical protein